ncbi:hypothetical protein SDC9_209516 [bioreactor metagenome]|uniref:Uncharacterized protein n=1 Tax=bioreactor metagenome TaxID=1076179 RepID=A0A645JN73_9ZZZZ
MRWKLGWNDIELVFHHVVIHGAPAGKHRRLLGLRVEDVAVLQRASGMTAGTTDGLTFGFDLGGILGRVGNLQGFEQGVASAEHGQQEAQQQGS